MKHLAYTCEEIAAITGGKIAGDDGSFITDLVTDSRSIPNPDGALFVAIKGDHHDGHRFLKDAWNKGIRNFMVGEMPASGVLPSGQVILVEDTVLAMQQLAARHRLSFEIPVIGITGSNGKTVVKEWLNALLSDDYIIARSPRSYNSQIGVPLSVWNLEPVHTLGIFEAGISQPGEMDRLRPVISPTLGVLTTIATAHLEHFSDQFQIAREKCLLFKDAEIIVYPRDNEFAHDAISVNRFSEKRLIGWGVHPDSALRVAHRHSHGSHTELILQWEDLTFPVTLTFGDHASVENSLSCIATLLALGYKPENIVSRLDRLGPLAMRMEMLPGANDCLIVNDSWSCDLDSLSIALDTASKNRQGRRLSVVLSDILQSGLPRTVLYDRVNAMLSDYQVDDLVGIGPELSAAAEQFKIKSSFFPDTETYLSSTDMFGFLRSVILVKGAREFRFERIVQLLEEKTHDTVLEVDLSAIAFNFHHFRSRLSSNTRIMVMVKAFGYGSGAGEVSSTLEFNKADYLAVAYADEGVALRKRGISLPIMVMNPERGSIPTMIRHRLEPEIYSFRILHQFMEAISQSHIDEAYPVHLKVDTGMHRLGFLPDEIKALCDVLKETNRLRIASVFTHLAASENPVHDAFTHEQVRLFATACDELQQTTGQVFLRHVLNTGGIQRFPEYQFDMVRLGVGLYGVSAYDPEQDQLAPVGRLRTVISQIKEVRGGESIGYGRNYMASRDMTIGVIPLGYADGLRRSLSNGIGSVAVQGKRSPIVGNVCMDMTMIDLSGISCREGDEVEVFGKEIPLSEFARWSQTIPYEVLTSISQRVRRIYLRD